MSDPLLSGLGETVIYQENGNPVAIDSSITLDDPSSANMSSARIFISGNFNVGDVLLFANTSKIQGNYNTATGVLTLNGIATQDEYEQALESIKFKTDSEIHLDRTISWTVTDAANGQSQTRTSAISFSTIDIVGVNDAPVLTGTKATLLSGAEDTAYTISKADLLAGFTDAEGDTMSVAELGLATSNGTVKLNSDGSVTVTPTANYNGPVTLSYNVVDGKGGSVAAAQSYTLAAVNDAPAGSATAVLAGGTEDVAYTVSKADLLAGFSDVDGDALSISGLTANGVEIKANADGSYTITPKANYNGEVKLNYSVGDGKESVAASQSYTLAAVNDAPTALNDSGFRATEDVEITIDPTLLLKNDNDPDINDSLQIASVSSISAKGSTVGIDAATGNVVYVANSSEFDSLGTGNTTTDTFSYTIKDKAGLESTATVSVTVVGAADGANIYGTVNPDAGLKALIGTTKNEQIEGNNGNDEIKGMAGIDRLMGQNGDDQLWGGEGNDKLWGDRGNDIIYGGQHNDDMFGGLGNDVFVFSSTDGANTVERIGDFKKGVDFLKLEDLIVEKVVGNQDVGKIDGGTIVGTGDGVMDTVLHLNNGTTIQLIGLNVASTDGLFTV